MKVLLLGEFSGLHRYLKEGLAELGADVYLAADGDGWKQIPGADSKLCKTDDGGFHGYFSLYIQPYKRLRDFRDYDVVQLINVTTFSNVVNVDIVRRLSYQNRMLSLVAAGGDCALAYAYCSGKFEYSPFDLNRESLEYFTGSSLKAVWRRRVDRRVTEMVDIIIPNMYDYSVGYEGNDKLSSVIPLPINVKGIDYQENAVASKVVFFHGLNRELDKGTSYIRKALTRLQENYPDEVEVIMDGHIPFKQYLELLMRTNVVVDQCMGYSYGINACVAMAQGKVVMASIRDESQAAIGVTECPVVHIQPDADQIYSQLEWLVQNKDKIPEIGYKSRQYVEQVHDHVKIAQRYVEAWKSTGKI